MSTQLLAFSRRQGMENSMTTLVEQIRALSGKRTNVPKIEVPPGSSFRLAAILAALVAVLLWAAQHVLQAGLPVH